MRNDPYLGGNIFDKYASKNPLVRFVVWLYLRRLFSLLHSLSFKTVLDVGGGEGYVAGQIAKRFNVSVVCVEPNRQFIQQYKGKQKRVSFVQGSAYHIPKKAESADLVLCLEVLEHLGQPEKALRELQRVAKRWIVVSVPNEPFFRMANLLRLAYLKRLGNTLGHVQNWTYGGFKRLIQKSVPQARFSNALLWNFALIEK